MKQWLKKISIYPDKTDIMSWIVSYFLINITFLFHSLNFMWGNHDVAFVKTRLLLTSGLFEGRFTQFIPYIFLTDGQILPILNNLIGFIFFVLGLWVLVKYWNIKKTPLNYILFIVFFATEPYTLSWLYFTHYTISCLLWVFLIALGLYLAEQISNLKKQKTLFILSLLCFYIPLGGYPPIINTIAICFGGRILFAYYFEELTLKQLLYQYRYTIVSILIAAILFKLTLIILKPDNVYNLETTPLSELPSKFVSTLKISFAQFITAVPFMEHGYKTISAAMCLLAFLGALFHCSSAKKRIIMTLLLIGVIWTSELTTFLVIPHTEFVSRIDFYGVAFLYVFFLGLLMKLQTNLAHSVALGFMIILIPFNILNDYRAMRVWTLGFNAEFEILDRITERIENHPNFSSKKQYRFYPVGDISLRPMYYHGKYDINDVFMLTLPYLAMWQAGNLLEFYMPTPYINKNTPITPEDITPEVYDFFMYNARPFPHANSIYINNDILIVIYNQIGLEEFRAQLHRLYPQKEKQ